MRFEVYGNNPHCVLASVLFLQGLKVIKHTYNRFERLSLQYDSFVKTSLGGKDIAALYWLERILCRYCNTKSLKLDSIRFKSEIGRYLTTKRSRAPNPPNLGKQNLKFSDHWRIKSGLL